VQQPTLLDSRRLPGPNLLSPRAGAVLDIACASADADRLGAAWTERARWMLDQLGWSTHAPVVRRHPRGASFLLEAPIDALYAATEVNEWLWGATLAGPDDTSEAEAAEALARLERTIAAERNPRLLALRDAARDRAVTFLSDDDHASVGLGTGSRTWPVDDLPDPGEVPWADVHDIPVALVTGSNGKTTTIRLLAAMSRAAGPVAGITSTDGIEIAGRVVEAGDWSGPGGARRVLRDTRVEVALLETARGGILRRGLGVPRATAALITNIAADHLGEFGVDDAEGIADAKLVVARAVTTGVLVLNADDPILAARGPRLTPPPTWFGVDPTHPLLPSANQTPVHTVVDGWFTRRHRGTTTRLAATAGVPITLGGAARHNVENVLGALTVAQALGFADDAVRTGLERFGGSDDDNPGRGNVVDLGGATVVVDFAHNPHGMDALIATARTLPARRCVIVLGQAGDRDDESIRALARAAWAGAPDLVIIKDMPRYLRGREPGAIPTLIEAELSRVGAPCTAIVRTASEWDAVEHALGWARPGDLVLLTIHAERERVLGRVHQLVAAGWEPGKPLPPEAPERMG
jgi:UDP-N-acetylmuramyl tripeptide synthase